VLVDLKEFGGGIDPFDQWDIGHLVSPVGQVHGKRRFRGPGDADKNNIRPVKAAQLLAVILFDRIIDRLHPLVVFGVDLIEEPRYLLGGHPENIRQFVQKRADEINGIQPMSLHFIPEELGQFRVDQGIDDDSRLCRYLGHRRQNILVTPQAAQPVQAYIHILKLGQGRPYHPLNRLPRRIGEKIYMLFHGPLDYAAPAIFINIYHDFFNVQTIS